MNKKRGKTCVLPLSWAVDEDWTHALFLTKEVLYPWATTATISLSGANVWNKFELAKNMRLFFIIYTLFVLHTVSPPRQEKRNLTIYSIYNIHTFYVISTKKTTDLLKSAGRLSFTPLKQRDLLLGSHFTIDVVTLHNLSNVSLRLAASRKLTILNQFALIDCRVGLLL